MGAVFKVIGVIGFIIVGFFGVLSLFGAIATAGLAGFFAVLVSCLIDCIIPLMFFALGSVMEDHARARYYSNAAAANNQNRQKKGIWDCECGRGNADYVSTCACGRRKPDDVKLHDRKMNDLNAMCGVMPVESKSAADAEREKRDNEIVAAGGWKCSCGRANQSYISTCACGKSRHNAQQ